MRKLTRRQFVKAGAVTAGAAAGAILLGPTLNLGSLVPQEKKAAAATAQWVASGCNGCVGWCPLQVKVVEGKAVKIRGNPNSKWTRGKLCPRGRLNLQILYDPDRVKKPLKRTNPKKGRDQDPGWVEISWEEALNTVAGKLKELRDKGTPERFALFRGRYTPLDADILYGRFGKAYGTPNTISHSALCDETNKSGNWYARGKYSYSSPDLEDANYILAFGTPFLESHRPTTGVLAAWPEGRRGRAIRPKTVVVDPRLSITAAKADEWVPINPGTDGALALGIAHHILTLGLWDRKFVGDFVDTAKKFVGGEAVAEADWQDAYTTGLVKWWNLFLKDFPPAEAAKKTGIPEETIKRLAREFAISKPAVTMRGRGAGAWPGNGTYNIYAIYGLNGLVGSVEVKGGVNQDASVTYSPEPIPLVQDDAAKAGTTKPRIDEKGTIKFPYADVITNNAADNVLKDYPYPIEVALGYWNNFTFSAPGCKRWEQALAKIPFVVHHTTHISEWSMYSDIVLPAKTYLEKWSAGAPAGGASVWSGVTLFQPVVEPLYDTKSEVELAIALGKKLGEHYPSIKKSFDGIGGPHGDTAEGYTKARTEVFWKALPGGWDEFKQKGTVNVGPYKFKWEFDTPSKKFEFYTGNLKALFEKLKVTNADLDTYHIKARGDLVYVPHYEDPTFIGDAAKYPLSLVTYKNQLNQEGRSANTQWAQEMYLNPLYGTGWTNLAEVNPETAKKYGIAEGDAVYVESEVGRIKATAKLSEGIHPAIVAMAYGQGHWAYGRWAKDKGANPNEITGVMYEHITGMAAYYNTRIRVSKV
ncbi:MAG: molybdopterin-dependent oxidoreductase [Dehalococcoidia bacterium]|nr:molybdopterin-dependent oxidoreductase [Dehalococcoidia bacterium]